MFSSPWLPNTGAKARPIAELAWRKVREWLDAR
jgi:hypothetical protein